MKTSKLLLGTVVGGVVYFSLGFIVYGFLMKYSMANSPMGSIMRAEADTQWWAAILSNLLTGFFLTWVFGRWANVKTLMGGVTAGAIIGVLISAAYDLGFYAWTTLFTLKDVGMDVVMSAVFFAITGGVIGWVLGMGKE